MIKFKSLSYKNFLSTGNNPVEIELDNNNRTLIIGTNGSGKSSMIDAISFCLFGKPHRSITKSQIINSQNKKNLLTTVEFSIGDNEYIVERGISPSKFTITENGNLVPVPSNIKDYQKFLEEKVLRMNQKTFEQVAVIGSNSYIPFMQLSSPNRRAFIEDLLDIGIFGVMKGLNREALQNLKLEISKTKSSIEVLEQNHQKLKEKRKKTNDELQALSKESHDEIKQYEDELKKIEAEYGFDIFKFKEHLENNENGVIDRMNDLNINTVRLKGSLTSYKEKLEEIVEKIEFYETHENCNECGQNIDESFCKTKEAELKDEKSRLEISIAKFEKHIETGSNVREKYKKQLNEIKIDIAKINDAISRYNELQSRVSYAKGSKESRRVSILSNIGEVQQDITDTENFLTDKKKILEDCYKDYDVNVLVKEILQDDGIKTCVIGKYIPLANKYINEYLKILDFFIAFELNEEFEETIKSRHRDKFSYHSFSEGEKQRIDLAILFTWRKIAELKNSASTNLLILDETFDASLDDEGIANLIKILKKFENNSIFVISHKRKQLESYFNSVFEFKKEKSFTKLFTSIKK